MQIAEYTFGTLGGQILVLNDNKERMIFYTRLLCSSLSVLKIFIVKTKPSLFRIQYCDTLFYMKPPNLLDP